MKRIRFFAEKDFQRIPEEPVILRPFDPKTRQIAQRYKVRLDKLLSPFGLKVHIKGSTILSIEGKGEIDLRIFVPDRKWLVILKYFINYYRRVETLEYEYALFVDFYQDSKIEIGLVRGERARIERKISNYLKSHADTLAEYGKLKRKYAYSARAYIRQKDKFFRSIWKK